MNRLDVVLRRLATFLGKARALSLLRVIGAVGLLATTALMARGMWRIPPYIDGLIAVSAAMGWTAWLDRRSPP